MDKGAKPAPVRPNESPASDRLDSWKEIAAYLKREVRTVQRWEKKEGLPVHRLLHDKLGSVYAFKSELDGWWNQRHVRLEQEEPEEPQRLRVAAAILLVAAAALAAIVYLVRERNRSVEHTPPAKAKLVVLPFENLSGDAKEDYFSDGLTEEMITQLGRLQPARLGVIARTSAMVYKGSGKSTEDICSDLGVNYMLEGSVRHAGGRVRIAAQLIQCGDQTHLWADTYDRDLRDILALQSDVARAIAAQIALTVSPRGQSQMAGNRPLNVEAYEAYLQGRFYWNRRDLEKSISYYNQAVARDPNFALAYAGLALSYVLLGQTPTDGLPPRLARPQVKDAANKALQLDPGLDEAHLSLANTYFSYDWNWAAAEREFKTALELNPNNPTAHEWYGDYLMVRGRPQEALIEAQHARELDPLAEIINSAYAEAYYYSGQYDRAIEQCRHALELYPNSLYLFFWLGSSYREKGMYPEAVAAFHKAEEISGSSAAMVMARGHVYAVSGNKREAEAALQELQDLSRKKYVPALYTAVVYVGLADKERAFQWLEKAYDERTDRLIYLSADPIANPLRSDPRFQELVRRVGLAP